MKNLGFGLMRLPLSSTADTSHLRTWLSGLRYTGISDRFGDCARSSQGCHRVQLW